jgi:hypothetical protein
MAEVARRDAGQVGTLADRINAEHRACRAAAVDALEHALAAGELLLQAKAGCPHGTWQDWVDDNFEGSLRTAQIYMHLARRRAEIGEAKTQSSALSSVAGALHLLSYNHAPVRAVEAVHAPTEEQRAAPEPLPLEYPALSRDVWEEHQEYEAKSYVWDQARLAARRGDRDKPPSVEMPNEEWQALMEREEDARIDTAAGVLFRVLDEFDDMHHSIGFWGLKPQEAGAALARMDDGNHPVTLKIREGAIADLRFGVAWLQQVLEAAEQAQRMQER